MLVITRRTGEMVVISDDQTGEIVAELTVLGVNGNQVRFGIAAERRYAVDRKEIYERKQRERHDDDHGGTPHDDDGEPNGNR